MMKGVESHPYVFILFYMLFRLYSTERDEPNTSKVREQDVPNLTKAGFVIAVSPQPASGCKR